tara:strand:- start:983 stop:1222 length:240 start_codon:yes stop_codon:yes gene_type:complete
MVKKKKKAPAKKKYIPTENEMLWLEVRPRITTTLSRSDFELICKLHAEEFKHKFYKFCTCNKKQLRRWIAELDDKLTIK